MKCEATTIVPLHLSKQLSAESIIESRSIWTDQGRDLEDDFPPKCRIVGNGFQ